MQSQSRARKFLPGGIERVTGRLQRDLRTQRLGATSAQDAAHMRECREGSESREIRVGSSGGRAVGGLSESGYFTVNKGAFVAQALA